MQMVVSAGYEESARDLYYEVKAQPSTTTTAQLERTSQIYLKGPSSPENINIVVWE